MKTGLRKISNMDGEGWQLTLSSLKVCFIKVKVKDPLMANSFHLPASHSGAGDLH